MGGTGVAQAGLGLLFMLLLSAPVSRDDVEGLLLMEEEGHSDLISFQPTDSDIPSFLEDCNRVRAPLPVHLLLLSWAGVSPQYSQRKFLFKGDWFPLGPLISLTLFQRAI